jgi:hypothetical protein
MAKFIIYEKELGVADSKRSINMDYVVAYPHFRCTDWAYARRSFLAFCN